MFHLLEHIDWNQVGGLSTFAGVVLTGLYKLWRSIKRKLEINEKQRDEKRTQQFVAIKNEMQSVFDQHEKLDQRRHEENIERFSEINMTLARHGINGGTPRRAHKR